MRRSITVQAMALRRQVRDLEQQAEIWEDRAEHPLTTEEARARFNLEAQQHRAEITEKQARILTLERSKQLPLF